MPLTILRQHVVEYVRFLSYHSMHCIVLYNLFLGTQINNNNYIYTKCNNKKIYLDKHRAGLGSLGHYNNSSKDRSHT